MLCQPLYGQNAVKDFFKYSTIYTSGVASNPMYAEEFWYTTQNGDLFNYTEEYSFDYTATLGIRKVARYPLKRVASSDEVANLIYFLASSEASYITGSYHPVDGGYLAS